MIKRNEHIAFVAEQMKTYDTLVPGEKTWRDLAEVAYIAYKHFEEYELILRSKDADVSVGTHVSGSGSGA